MSASPGDRPPAPSPAGPLPASPEMATRSERIETPNSSPTIDDADLFGAFPPAQAPVDCSRQFDPRCPVLPSRFGPYLLESRIDAGGMGIVYKARHLFNPANPSMGRVVALKMILPEKQGSAQVVKRFLAEAQSAARLEYHPNIVQIYDVGEIEGVPYFSMQYISGGCLQNIVDEQHVLPHQKIAKLMKKVAEAVHFAHTEANIIHRDIKPSNILLGRDLDSEHEIDLDQLENASFKSWSPKLTDFGLARNSDSALTIQGEVMGTPSYMPPEQALGDLDRIGPRSDVYSLGAVLYALLTGRPPFDSPNPQATIARLLHEVPVPPQMTEKGKATPPDLERICLKCLEKDPNRRYESARAFAEDLDRFLAGEPIQATPGKPLSVMFRKARRRAWQLAGVLIVLLCLGVVTAFIIRERHSQKDYQHALEHVENYQKQAGESTFKPDEDWSAASEQTFARLTILPEETELARKGARACYQLAEVLKDRGHKPLASEAAKVTRTVCKGLEWRQEFAEHDRLLRAKAQLLLGQIDVDRLDFKGAEDQFNAAMHDLDRCPNSDDALLTEARIEHARGDMFFAQGEYEKAVQAQEASIRHRTALLATYQNRLDGKTRDYHNDLARGYAYAAGSYLELGNLQQAATLYQKAEDKRRELDAKYDDNKTRQHVARSLGNTGRLLLRNNKTKEAIRPFGESVTQLKNIVLDSDGKIAEFVEDLGWASLEFAEALLDNGRQPEGFPNPGRVAEDAEKWFRKLLESDPENPMHLRGRARARLNQASWLLKTNPDQANELLDFAFDQLNRLDKKHQPEKETLYSLAVAASIRGERSPPDAQSEVKNVYRHLDRAIKHGFSDVLQIQRDRRLRFWRDTKKDELDLLVQRLRKNQKGTANP